MKVYYIIHVVTNFYVANMSFNAICENKILAEICEFTVLAQIHMLFCIDSYYYQCVSIFPITVESRKFKFLGIRGFISISQ